MSQPANVQVPFLASWLLNLLTPPDQAEPISGDLSEEFATMASTLGSGRARRWYWQQAVKSSAHLLAREFRASPATIAVTALAGYILLWCAVHLVGVATDVFLRWTPDLYRQVSAKLFWSIYAWAIGLAFEQLVFPALVGWMLAAVAKGREMAFALTLGTILGLLGSPHRGGVLSLIAMLANLDRVRLFLPHTFWRWIVLNTLIGSVPAIAVLVGAVMRRKRALPEPPVAA